MNNLNPELYLVILTVLSGFLFALGGTQISPSIKGKKWIRRFLLPFIFAVFCLLAGFVWWKALLVALIAIGSFYLGYSAEKPFYKRALAALSFGCISLPIGISFWNVFAFGGFLFLFWLSNNNLTKRIFVHKCVELGTGFFIGLQLSFLLSGNGHVW